MEPLLLVALVLSVLVNLALAATLAVAVRGLPRPAPPPRGKAHKARKPTTLAALRPSSKRATIAELLRHGLPEATVGRLTGASRGEVALASRLGQLRDGGDDVARAG